MILHAHIQYEVHFLCEHTQKITAIFFFALFRFNAPSHSFLHLSHEDNRRMVNIKRCNLQETSLDVNQYADTVNFKTPSKPVKKFETTANSHQTICIIMNKKPS